MSIHEQPNWIRLHLYICQIYEDIFRSSKLLRKETLSYTWTFSKLERRKFEYCLPLGRPPPFGLELVVDGEDLESDPCWNSKFEPKEALEVMTGDTSSMQSPAASQLTIAVVLKASSKALLTALSLNDPARWGLLLLIHPPLVFVV